MSSYLIETIGNISTFFNEYYLRDSAPNPIDFLLSPDPSLALGGQILVHESEGALEIGIQFGTELHEAFACPSRIGAHEFGIVSEEISHFLNLYAAASSQSSLSVLDLEVFGEIDRFIAFIYSNRILTDHKMNEASPQPNPLPRVLQMNSLSLAGLCESQFANRFFSCADETLPLYLQAETLALKHLQRAFGHRWNDSYLDSNVFDLRARAYLSELRSAVTARSQSVRLFLECA
jgi:hypothetical protein